MARISNKLQIQIREEFEKLVSCSNELWRLQTEFDFAIDNLEQALLKAEILKEDER